MANLTGNPSLEEALRTRREAVETYLDEHLPRDEGAAAELCRAMRYSIFAGGKRVRPILCILAAEASGGTLEDALPGAAALECIHTYSLIHDDLPCMDDDDLRRGRPTSHKVFGEGMATLAGDGLLTLAFDLVATGMEDAERSRRITAEISGAAGYPGMVGGQAIDLLQTAEVEEIHRRKTQALIAASLRTGAIAAGADEDTIGILGTYGEKIGLAFQIADDLLDEEGTTAEMGKTAGKDRIQQKLTYPGVYGAARSRQVAGALIEEAKGSLAGLGSDTTLLATLADFILSRKR